MRHPRLLAEKKIDNIQEKLKDYAEDLTGELVDRGHDVVLKKTPGGYRIVKNDLPIEEEKFVEVNFPSDLLSPRMMIDYLDGSGELGQEIEVVTYKESARGVVDDKMDAIPDLEEFEVSIYSE